MRKLLLATAAMVSLASAGEAQVSFTDSTIITGPNNYPVYSNQIFVTPLGHAQGKLGDLLAAACGINANHECNITGGTFTTGTITDSAVNGGTISGAAISSGTIDGAAISTSTIDNSDVTGGTITGSAISGGTIIGSAISGGTLAGLTSPLAVASGGLGSAVAPASGQIAIGNAGGTAYAPQTVSGDITLGNGGVTVVVGLSHVTNHTLPLTGLASQNTNTIVGANTTGSPTALTIPSCSASVDALIWTSNSGFGCNASVNAATLGGATFAAPGAIGGTTPGAGIFTGLTTTGTPAAGQLGNYAQTSTGDTTATVTITQASPGVITWTGGNLQNGSVVHFTTTGGLPTGLTVGVNYFVVAASANTFEVALTPGGTAITTTSAGTGVQTATASAILTTGVPASVASITLTAGNYDVYANGVFFADPTSTGSLFIASVSGIGATLPTVSVIEGVNSYGSATPAGVAPVLPTGAIHLTPITTTTYYLVVEAKFAIAGMQAGGVISAMRTP